MMARTDVRGYGVGYSLGDRRFRDLALVSGQLGFEVGPAFLEELDLLAPRDAFKIAHHLRVISSDKAGAAHAFYIEDRQLARSTRRIKSSSPCASALARAKMAVACVTNSLVKNGASIG